MNKYEHNNLKEIQNYFSSKLNFHDFELKKKNIVPDLNKPFIYVVNNLMGKENKFDLNKMINTYKDSSINNKSKYGLWENTILVKYISLYLLDYLTFDDIEHIANMTVLELEKYAYENKSIKIKNPEVYTIELFEKKIRNVLNSEHIKKAFCSRIKLIVNAIYKLMIYEYKELNDNKFLNATLEYKRMINL